MTSKALSIAIVGAGIGGLATAAALRNRGFTVNVYEQAQRSLRIGAGIQMSPNAMKVLREPLVLRTSPSSTPTMPAPVRARG